MNHPVLHVAGVAVRQDAEGRYSLNDLHRAAGGEAKHQPAKFMRLSGTLALAAEIDNSPDVASFAAIEGRNGGTYVVRELVYAYAMWISPAFNLKVIRAFDALVSGDVDGLPESVRAQIGGIVKAVVGRQIDQAIEARLPSLVAAVLARQQIGVRHGVSAGQVWAQYGLPPLKNAAQMLSRLLGAFGCAIDGGGRAQAGRSTAKLFDPDKVDKAMKSGLLEHCRRYVGTRKGNGQLFAVPERDLRLS